MPSEGQVPIYLIGITGRYRGAPLEAQLHQAGLRFERIEGVTDRYDGRPVADYYDDSRARVVSGRPLLPGEIGCALAHRVARRTFLDSDADWALILEDDARIRDAARLQTLLDAARANGGRRPAIIALFARSVIALQDPDGPWQALARVPRTTTAYLINRSAAKALTDYELPLICPADWPLRGAWRIRFSAAFPWTVTPDESGDSLIVDPSAADHDGAPAASRAARANKRLQSWWWAHRRAYEPNAGWSPIAMRRSFRAWWVHEVQYMQAARMAGRPPYALPDDAVALPTVQPAGGGSGARPV